MNSEIRIPTILGLGVLVIGLIVGVFLITNNRFLSFRTKASPTIEPKNVTLANISDTSVSIYWQTDQQSSGFIQAGTNPSLDATFKDDRDLDNPQNHLFHFVTLTKLKPSTTYFYKMVSGSVTYPSGNPLSFTTSGNQEILSLKPIIGTILENNQQPVTEAIITLDIPEAQNLAAITKVSGNFILPLSRILTKNLAESFKIPESGISATLTVFNQEKSSRTTLQLPLKNEVLPAIILGQELDLTQKIVSPTSSLPNNSLSVYDLNQDGVINSLDLATLRQNIGKDSKLNKGDFNNDEAIDQKDADVLSKSIPNISPR